MARLVLITKSMKKRTKRKVCPGCLTLPTTGFDSKPPNPDGFTHWCQESRALAAEQEAAKRDEADYDT